MAEENKGVALAILGVVAVIAVVGLVLLFTRITTGGVSAPHSYGDAVYTRQSIATIDDPEAYSGYEYETYLNRPGVGVYYTGGAGEDVYGEVKQPKVLEPGFTYKRAPASIPSGQICATGEVCPRGTFCIEDPRQAPSESWSRVPGTEACYSRESSI